MRPLIALLSALLLVYIMLAIAACSLQSRLIYRPELGRDETATPAASHIAFEDVRIVTADGETLRGWFVAVPDSVGTAALFHGNAGTISHRIGWLPMFRNLRLSSLLFDYRGYGASSGRPTESGTYADADAVWNYLTATRGVPASRIVLIGESLGGAIAAQLAARRNPGALVLHSAFTSVPDLGAELYPILPVRWLARFDYGTLSFLREVNCPVLVAHSRDDDIVPFGHGLRLFAAARPPKAIIELSGSHNGAFLYMRPAWVRAFGDFLRRALK